MKQWIQFLALMLTISMGACSSDEILIKEEHQSCIDGEITNIEAIAGSFETDDFESRTTIVMGESTIDKLVWAENDSIGIYPTTGDQLSFPIINGVGTSTCTFDGGGWALKNSASYTAYSPFNRAYYYENVDELPVSILGQKQTGNGSTDHMGKYDLQIAKGTTPESGKVKFQFQHQVCFLRMDLIAPIASTWKSITLESDASFTTEATMNLSSTTPTVIPVSASNKITLQLENVTTTSDDLSIVAYMMLLPVDLTDKSLNITLTDSENKTYTTEASITSTNHNFGAAKARWITGKDFQVTIHVEEAGTLSSYISEENKNLISSLKLSGNLNGTDIKFIREMTGRDANGAITEGKLTNLDLEETTIKTGGEAYCSYPNTSYTSNKFLGDYFLYECSNIKSIKLPIGLTSISNYSFTNCTSLETITIPESIVSIGSHAFSNCNSLTNVVLPSNLNKIGNQAFLNCTSINSITLPSNLSLDELNDNYIFAGCKGLTNLKISSGVKVLSQDMFRECSTLTQVTLPSSITTIGGLAFYGTALEHVYVLSSTPPKVNTAFLEIPSSCILYVPKGCTSVYEASDWQYYFTNIVELE